MTQIDVSMKRNRLTNKENRPVGGCGGGGAAAGRDGGAGGSQQMSAIIYEGDKQQGLTVQHGEPYSISYDKTQQKRIKKPLSAKSPHKEIL